MNDEKLAIDTLKALGAKDTTSNAQKKNAEIISLEEYRIQKNV